MKIVVAERIAKRGLELLRREFDVVALDGALDRLPQALTGAEGLIVRSAVRVTREVLEVGALLRVIGRAGIGVDNIDLEAATRRGVLVMNTRGGNAVSVAEHTIALLLSLARQIPQANLSVHAGGWEKTKLTGTELKGKSLGLVGLGKVGVEVARRAVAFEMRIVAHDPYVSHAIARDCGVTLLGLDELLASSDFISLHATLSPATARMINRDTIAKMKPGARVINTARGELIVEGALAEAIRSGHLAGAALDVFAEEPPRSSPLAGLEPVIMTPHIAGSTEEAQEEVGFRIAQQVRDYLAEGIIRNALNLPTVSAEEFRRMKPYLDLGERLGAFLVQIAGGHMNGVQIRSCGEPGEMNTQLLRNAALMGILNRVLSEQANLVNAASLAQARGLLVEESISQRTAGFPDTIAVALRTEAGTVSVEGTVLHGKSLRILAIDDIEIEAPLAGTLLFLRNRDVPGVIGQVGSLLGNHNINIATFALGRREDSRGTGGAAVAVVGVDHPVPEEVLELLRRMSAIKFAQVVKL